MAKWAYTVGEGQSRQQMMLGKAYIYIEKNSAGPLPYLHHVLKLTQNGLYT